jgi:hypothetical protein
MAPILSIVTAFFAVAPMIVNAHPSSKSSESIFFKQVKRVAQSASLSISEDQVSLSCT